MASSIGSTIASFGAPFIPDLSESANIQTALKLLYYGTGGTLNNSNGIHGALYTLYTGNPSLAGSAIFTNTNGVTLASTNHAFQIGASASTNLAVSPAIIQARNNGAASALSINSLGGNVTIGNASSTVTIVGDLTVSGNTTTLDVATLAVEDAEIVIGNVAIPSNTTANGGGIRLEAGTDVDKTITWDSANTNWTTSEHWNIATGKTLKIANVAIASGTGAALVLGGNASTTLSLGANGGTASILNPTVTLTNATVLNINGASPSIVTSSTGTASIFNTNALTINVGNAATTASIANAATTLNIGNTATAAQTVNMFTASNGASTYNIATGPTGTGVTKTINIGTGGSTGSTTNVNMLQVQGGGALTVNGDITIAGSGNQLLLPNGSTTTAPLKFTGTTTTSFPNWSAGDMEYDGKIFRATPGNAGYAIIETSYIDTLDADLSVTTSTTTALGNTITLPVGYYHFEAIIPFQFTYAASATALSLGIKGTATTTGVYFLQEHFSNTGALTNQSFAANVDPSGLVTAGRVITQWRQQTSVQSLNTSNLISQIDSITTGNRYGIFRIKGWLNITTSGSFYPAATLTGGGSASIKAGAFIKISPMSDGGSGYWQAQV